MEIFGIPAYNPGQQQTLHVATLLQYQQQDREAVCSFQEAERLAGQLGIELSLPPLHAQAGKDRRCPFIRDQAVFVAKSGDVMPCHFLWQHPRYLRF